MSTPPTNDRPCTAAAKSDPFNWIALGFLTIGLGLLVADAFLFAHRQRFIAAATATSGKVVAMKEHRRAGQSSLHAPVVRAQLPDGRETEFTGDYARPPEHAVGDVVRVLYLPGRPDEAVVDTWSWRWFFASVILILGVGFTAMGGGVLYAAWHFRVGRPIARRGRDVGTFNRRVGSTS